MNEIKRCPTPCERNMTPVKALTEAYSLAELARQILLEDVSNGLDGNAMFGLSVIMAEIGERVQLGLLAGDGLPELGQAFPAAPPARPAPGVMVTP